MFKFNDIGIRISEKVIPGETDLDRYVGLEHLDSESLKIKRWGSPSDVIGEKLRVRPGEIIFGKRRAYQRKLAIAEFDCICSAHAMVLKAKEDNLRKDFFPFFLQSDVFMDRALEISVGSLSPTINWGTLKNQEFPLPPLVEQKRIAEVLWAVENAIWKTEDAIEGAERYRKVLMRHLFMYGPVGEINEIQLKNTQIGPLPTDWDVVKLVEICEDEKDIVAGPFGSNLKVSDYRDAGVPIIRLQNIDRGRFIPVDIKHISVEKAEELKYHSYLPGDIVLAKLGDPIGKTCIIPDTMSAGIVVADVVRIRPDPDRTNLNFIQYLLNSHIVIKQLMRGTIGTTRPRVNLNQVRDILIPCPSIEIQNKIEEVLSQIDVFASRLVTNIEDTRLMKMTILNGILSENNMKKGGA
jgi:restriction endonuclease S subunit